MGGRLKILVAGMVAGNPQQGGASWAVLQYVFGLESLGHEVLLVEPVPAAALERGLVADYFRALPLRAGGAALVAQPGARALGLPYEDVLAFAAQADLLLNVSGMLRDERLLEAIDVRAFLDLDPGFNQIWHSEGVDMGFAEHTRFVTVGGLVGTPSCPIPTCGREWVHTLPPVALEHWPLAPDPPRRDAFTSVGHWRSYGSLEYGGIHYGQRAHSLRELIDLPRRSAERFELALGIDAGEPADLRALSANGWRLLDPAHVAADPAAYRDFVRGSKAELCVAKSGYVASRSGWFSDRSACYLASGRPVVAQDTGFGARLPAGEGLLAFTSAEEAAQAVAEVAAHPARHRAAARALAEEHLDARKVLGALVHELGSKLAR
jgi:hypothetical protein